MRKQQGLEYLRTQSTNELQRIVSMITKSEAAGYTRLAGDTILELATEVLQERNVFPLDRNKRR